MIIQKNAMRNTLFFLFFTFFTLFSCSIETSKVAPSKLVENSDYTIPESYFTDTKQFPKLSKRFKNKTRKTVQEYFQNTFGSAGFSGGFLVAKNGQIIYENYSGYSFYDEKKEVKSTTALHLASVGKVLTATAIFRLLELNKLKLDQSVNSILPEFPYDSITVRMLLNHRSGIPKYANFASIDTVWNKHETLSNQNILGLLARFQFPLDFEPDSKFTYNNSNYAILALVIEKLTNKRFDEAMKTLVFDPIGMKHSYVMILKRDSLKAAESYQSSYTKVPFDFLDAVYGDKNIYSTPRDLLRYDLAMQNNQFISENLEKEIFKGYSYEKAGVKNYGLGIRIKEWSANQQLFYHHGWWHGNTSCYLSMKKEKVTIVILSNKYSRKVYDVMRLSSLFGDYPYNLEGNN
jgi:CubicO group peptidase (beta-lactamase class C family)